MLSESEQQRLADIEAALRNDTRFVNGFERALTRRVTPRRITADVIAVAGMIGAVVGLAAGSVPMTVLAICSIGAAACVWTWRSPNQPEAPPPPPASPFS